MFALVNPVTLVVCSLSGDHATPLLPWKRGWAWRRGVGAATAPARRYGGAWAGQTAQQPSSGTRANQAAQQSGVGAAAAAHVRVKPRSSTASVPPQRRARGSGAWAGQVAQLILYGRLAIKQVTLCGPFWVVARAEATERRAAAAAGAAAQRWCCLAARARRCCAAFRWRRRARCPAHPRARPPARFPSVGESARAERVCSTTAVPWPAAK